MIIESLFTRVAIAGAVIPLTLASYAVAQEPADHTDHAAHQSAATATTASAERSPEAVVTNTRCPVMPENPVNPDIFVEHEGQRVYFCCDGCPAAFQQNPEQHLSRLPQFGGTESAPDEGHDSTESEPQAGHEQHESPRPAGHHGHSGHGH
jgi:hypothetical protein